MTAQKKPDVTNNEPKINLTKPLISDESLELLTEMKSYMRSLDPRKPQTTNKVKRNLKFIETLIAELKEELEIENA